MAASVALEVSIGRHDHQTKLAIANAIRAAKIVRMFFHRHPSPAVSFGQPIQNCAFKGDTVI